MINIKLNGETWEVNPDMDILSFLIQLEISPGSIVVEHNRKIINKNLLDHTVLKDGDELELIRFVGGG